MREGRGEGGEKLSSSNFKRKKFRARYGLTLKEGKRRKQDLPHREIPKLPCGTPRPIKPGWQSSVPCFSTL